MDRQGFQKVWNKLVARAWSDGAFKKRLLTDPEAVFKEYGYRMPPTIAIQVVENGAGMIHLRCSRRGAPEWYVECTSACYHRLETSSQMQIWSMWRAGWRTGMTVSRAARP
jgi:hypothetical protein